MVLAKSVKRGLVDCLGNVVGNNQVEHLSMEHIVGVEHHLSQQPVIGRVERGVCKVASSVGLDCERKEVLALGIDIEVCRAGNWITLDDRRKSVAVLVRVCNNCKRIAEMLRRRQILRTVDNEQVVGGLKRLEGRTSAD